MLAASLLTDAALDKTTPSNDEFVRRHIGPSADDQQRMLEYLQANNLQELVDAIVPDAILDRDVLADLDEGCSEQEALMRIRTIAAKNKTYKSFIGQGYYGCYTPSVIARNVLENPGWYTSYTPYQSEISQGRLEALLNFQSMVCDLTGLELANASLLDEATASAEAMILCRKISKSDSNKFFVSQHCLPQTIAVLQTRAEPIDIELVIGDHREQSNPSGFFGVLLQYPSVCGEVFDYQSIIQRVHQHDTLVVMACDLLSLLLLRSPGELGADVAVGNSQRFGVPLGFGGPHAAYMSTREKFKRALPGRIVGVSVDSSGKPAYRLALQTREQHIRREKANSNICTAQALLAIMAGMYAVYHGPEGLKAIAMRVHRLMCTFAEGLQKLDFELVTQTYFDTVTIVTGARTADIHAAARACKINLRNIDDETLGVSFDETTDMHDVESLWEIFAQQIVEFRADELSGHSSLPKEYLRTDAILQHPVFHRYCSETEMMRYLRKLSDRDIALDRAMIPLGSCTMKLNAATEMAPISWPQFADVHPFVPAEQSLGYDQLITQLERMLCIITGYDAVSLQPNAGSQGEYAGLLAIRAYYRDRNQEHRNVCLIPASAHGTNPASAQMCNMRVVVVACDQHGNVDIADLEQKAAEHSQHLAAIMVTYPSTHGVFEEHIRQVCEIVHGNGGQVYIDGANLNAMVGLCQPGKFGGDVSHLNLHKTFCIPHGGGGPGVGPVCVRQHLAPYLPGHFCLQQDANKQISAAAWGSAGILAISWMYITLMGRTGLQRASEVAILNANYLAARLQEHYPILYAGANGRVAHECIIDLRTFKNTADVTVEDVAKRLIDFGFHAPTMSFPVAGTLMIEPTESESLQEIDRFCDAMLQIHAEIRMIENGHLDKADNPLKNAPHTAEALIADHWEHAYSRNTAAYPVASLREHKYWAPVGRIDNPHGDRNLICSCPATDEYSMQSENVRAI